MINKVTRRSMTLDQTHFTVDTLGLGRLLLARAILSAGTSRRIWALIYVWSTLVCVCVYFVSSMGTTGSREHNATIEGRKFAISTRARHVSSQPPPRLTNLLSVSNAFLFPSSLFLTGNLSQPYQNKVWKIRVHREFYVSNVFDPEFLIITLNIRDILDHVWNLIKDHREFYIFESGFLLFIMIWIFGNFYS